MRRLLIAQAEVGAHAHIRLSALTVRSGEPFGGLNKQRGIARRRRWRIHLLDYASLAAMTFGKDFCELGSEQLVEIERCVDIVTEQRSVFCRCRTAEIGTRASTGIAVHANANGVAPIALA